MKFNIPQHLLEQANKHAEMRGMSLEEYLEEFIGLINEHNKNNPDKPLDLANWPIPDKVSSNS
tara:strand:- start:423 stop:611 length:189 start_codon:yes stop_codon:yes gene_type:complete